MHNSFQNDKCSFTFHLLLVHATTPTVSTKNLIQSCRHLLPCYITFLPVILSHYPYNFHQNSLYTSDIFHLPISTYSHPCNPHLKQFPLPQPLNQFKLFQRTNEQVSHVWTDTDLISTCFPKAWTRKAALTINYFLLFILSKFVYFGQQPVMKCLQSELQTASSSPIPSISCCYFHTLLIPSQDLTSPWKPAV